MKKVFVFVNNGEPAVKSIKKMMKKNVRKGDEVEAIELRSVDSNPILGCHKIIIPAPAKTEERDIIGLGEVYKGLYDSIDGDENEKIYVDLTGADKVLSLIIYSILIDLQKLLGIDVEYIAATENGGENDLSWILYSTTVISGAKYGEKQKIRGFLNLIM